MRQRIKDIIYYKTYAELKSESQRYYLGFLWWLIEPVMYMLVFYFVFGVLFQRGTEDFVPFLLTGLVFWQWFQTTVMQCADVIASNRYLLNQVFVPKYVFPAVILSKNTAKFGIVLVMLIVFLLVYGIEPSPAWFAAPLVLAVGGVLVAGVSALVASVTPIVPDLRVVFDNGLRALLFLSGIFYDIDSFDSPYRAIFHLNPIAIVIDNLRGVLLDNSYPDWWQLGGVLLVASCLGAGGLAIMRANESRYVKIAY